MSRVNLGTGSITCRDVHAGSKILFWLHRVVRGESMYADMATDWNQFAKAMAEAMDKFRQYEGEPETQKPSAFAHQSNGGSGGRELEPKCSAQAAKDGHARRRVRTARPATSLETCPRHARRRYWTNRQSNSGLTGNAKKQRSPRSTCTLSPRLRKKKRSKLTI